MADLVQFPSEDGPRVGFQRVKSRYSVRDISRQFGIGEHHIRRWVRDGVVPADPATVDEIRFDFRALKQFRRVRELRLRGLTFRQIEAELHGQLSLFPEPPGQLIRLPARLSPFEEAVLLHEKDAPAAEEAYLRAIEQGDAVADAYCNLGIMEFERNNVPAAFDRFTMSLRHDPRHYESHFNLASLYFEQGELRLARLHYELAARLEPCCVDSHFNLALVHAMDGRVSEAIEVLRLIRQTALEEEWGRIDRLLRSLDPSQGS